MSFRYVNPGYAELLGNENADYKANVNAAGKSKTGYAFTCSRFNFFKVPSTLENDEIWLKCNFYLPNRSAISFYFGNGYGTSNLRNGVNFSGGSGGLSLYIYNDGSSSKLASVSSSRTDLTENTGARLNAINSIWLHIKFGEAGTGFLELQINNKKFDKIQDIKFSLNYKTFGVMEASTNNPFYFSNIIVSDEYVDPYEEIIPLPIASTETDMTFDSDTGIYTANAANQTLMSAVNADYLANEYGSDSAVTGIALIGNPAYKTASGLTSLTAQSKENNVVSDIETISLDDDTSAMILASQKISNKTIADLQNVQFGWKAGA